MHIVQTVFQSSEYLVFPRKILQVYCISWGTLERSTEDMRTKCHARSFLRKGKGRPGITKGYVLIRVPGWSKSKAVSEPTNR